MNRLKLKASKLMPANTITSTEDMLLSSSPRGVQPSSSSPGKCLATTPGIIKSGYDIKNQAEVIKTVQWPHGYLSQIQNITATHPDKLAMDAFFYGYFSILINTKDMRELHGRLQHAKQLMTQSILHGWESARSFHYSALREIEIGNICWDDQASMHMLALAASGNVRQNASSVRTVKREEAIHVADPVITDWRSIFCYLFNNSPSGCKYEKMEGGCKKLHACSKCANSGFLNSHGALDCKK